MRCAAIAPSAPFTDWFKLPLVRTKGMTRTRSVLVQTRKGTCAAKGTRKVKVKAGEVRVEEAAEVPISKTPEAVEVSLPASRTAAVSELGEGLEVWEFEDKVEAGAEDINVEEPADCRL